MHQIAHSVLNFSVCNTSNIRFMLWLESTEKDSCPRASWTSATPLDWWTKEWIDSESRDGRKAGLYNKKGQKDGWTDRLTDEGIEGMTDGGNDWWETHWRDDPGTDDWSDSEGETRTEEGDVMLMNKMNKYEQISNVYRCDRSSCSGSSTYAVLKYRTWTFRAQK